MAETDELHERLAAVSAQIDQLAPRLQELQAERRALILCALDYGWTHAQIAQATGLSRGRIGQIAS